MPKSQDNRIKCRPIPPPRVTEHRSVSISTRPLKLAFLINEATPGDQLLKYFAYNSTVWGGFYNPLIPTDGQSLRPDWWRVLLSHSPDKLIVCGSMSDDLLQEVYARVQPYSLWAWSDAAIGGEKIDRDPFGNVPLVYQLLHIYETSRPISKSNFRVARCPGTHLTRNARRRSSAFCRNLMKVSIGMRCKPRRWNAVPTTCLTTWPA